MREKTLRTVVAFRTTTDALAMEAWCAGHDIPGRLIPLPTIISAGCGMCWSAPDKARAEVLDAAKRAGINTDGIYQMML